ncbi:hypothetical protein EC968_007849, partial [Mortierella alpina]
MVTRGVGWALAIYKQADDDNEDENQQVYLKSCLGVYQCPSPDCKFVERPRVPRGYKPKH